MLFYLEMCRWDVGVSHGTPRLGGDVPQKSEIQGGCGGKAQRAAKAQTNAGLKMEMGKGQGGAAGSDCAVVGFGG